MAKQFPTQKYLLSAPVIFSLLILGLGLVLRFANINNDNFFLYDEGYYLNYNRPVLELIDGHFPVKMPDMIQAVYLSLRAALATGKPLWFFIVDARVFFGGVHQWFFPHLVSAVFGTLTLGLVFLFARKLFNSTTAGLLSLMILNVLPSHVFYSRLALQEGLCAFLFLAGFYFYLFPARFGAKTFLSSFLLVLAYFSNYRLVILPGLVLFAEFYISLSSGQKPNFRKYFWHTLIFIFLVLMIGSIDKGRYITVVFAWMFHQADLAQSQRHFLDLFSYPYYIFRLEGIVFATLFFANGYYLMKRQWQRAFCFSLACFYMLIFSLTAEKGARYLCVMLPFMAMAVAGFLEQLFSKDNLKINRKFVVIITIILFAGLIVRSIDVAQFRSDYKNSVKYIRAVSPQFKIITTQPWIQKLYVSQDDVAEMPKNYEALLGAYKKGYRYLIICPQAFISWTDNKEKFDPHLLPYLKFITTFVEPVKTFSHFNNRLLERFVFEHNENLKTSVQFLSSGKKDLGALRVYDLKTCINAVENVYHPKKGK
ncbi:MAG: glycosyltransferase family 39 protein [Candidatus Omnitrophota bacterium]